MQSEDCRPNFRWFNPPSEEVLFMKIKGKKRNGEELQKDLAGERNPQPGKSA